MAIELPILWNNGSSSGGSGDGSSNGNGGNGSSSGSPAGEGSGGGTGGDLPSGSGPNNGAPIYFWPYNNPDMGPIIYTC